MILLTGLALARTITFAGHDWQIKTGTEEPGPNIWSDATESVWLDDLGALHLAIRETDGVWTSAEVFLDTTTGFGVHRVYADTFFDLADPNVVVGFAASGGETTKVGVELSKFGDAGSDTVWHTVLPAGDDTQRTFKPTLGGSFTTHSFDWQADSVHFQSLHGHFDAPPDSSYVIGDWTSTSDTIPGADADLTVHLRVWLLDGEPPADGAEVEVIFWNVDLPEPDTTQGDDTGTTDCCKDDTGPGAPEKTCSCATAPPVSVVGLLLAVVASRRRSGRFPGWRRRSESAP